MDTERECLSSPRLAPAIGPYSQAVRCGNLLFCSGIVPVDPKTGKLVSGGIEAQTRRVLDNLSLLLEDCGTHAGNVLKTTVFLKDMADFQALNVVYARHFPEDPPARSTVQVAALPLDSLVEVEAIAVLPHD